MQGKVRRYVRVKGKIQMEGKRIPGETSFKTLPRANRSSLQIATLYGKLPAALPGEIYA
jgi:hypothetical protein